MHADANFPFSTFFDVATVDVTTHCVGSLQRCESRKETRMPIRFPNVAVLAISGSTLTEDTFSVPAATGCGPGGVANAAINATLGLPSPSGNNHLVLNDNDALFADDFSATDQARDLLEAFQASR
jgi:hypothetical protein